MIPIRGATPRLDARPARARLREQLTDWGTPRAGAWSVRCRSSWHAERFDAGAFYAALGGGPDQLRKNLARVIGVPPSKVPDSLMRASLASYARYWREAFRLPSMDLEEAGRAPRRCFDGAEHFDEALEAGRGRGGRAAAQRQLGHGRGVAGATLRHLHHRRGAAQTRVAVPALHRLPGNPGLRGGAVDRRRTAAVRGARRPAARRTGSSA